MNRMLLSALLGTAAFVPGAAFAQSPECDRLLLLIEQNQGAQLPVDVDRVRVLQTERNEAECVVLIQQVEAQVGQAQQQPAQPGAADSQDANATPEAQEGQQQGQGANITVQQPAPTITVDQATPQITVQQAQPNVMVRQPQPEIIVRQPAPVVTIDIPQPEIIVRMPQPEVTVEQAQPQVQVQQAAPEVSVVQPEQPQVQVQESAPAQVQVTQPEGEANIQVEQVGEANVTYERAEPQVTINQAEGQPTVTIEQMEGQPAAGQPAGAMADSQDPNATPEAMEGQQPAAGAMADSQDPNATPEAMEGAAGTEQPAAQQQAAGTEQPAAQQQAAATQAGQQPMAGGQMQPLVVREIEGMDVINMRGEQLGEAGGLVRSAADSKMYLVIEHGGFLGLGEKQVALSLEGLMMQGERIIVPGLTDDEIRALPDFEESDQYPEVEDAEVQIRTSAQQ